MLTWWNWCWRHQGCLHHPTKWNHPLDTEDGHEVGLSSEDEVEGLPEDPGMACREVITGPAPAPAPEPRREDEVVVKKRALKRVKQQVGALLRGEDLLEGTQAREVAEVPYQLPPVPRDAKECPICQQVFKTHHRLMCHMGVHRGEKFPCEKCEKVLASRRMLRVHVPACVQGRKVLCPDCDWSFASQQGMKQAFQGSAWVRGPWKGWEFPVPPLCKGIFSQEEQCGEHSRVCAENLDRKGPFYW